MQYKIIVDKQPSSNPSDEKKEYIIDIEELRVKGDVYDSLNIEKDRTYVTRRLSLSEYGVLSVLDEPIIQELTDLNIELFEGDNYIYLMDMQGNKFYAEYLIKNDFNDIYATKNEMNSAITQSAQSIELSVNQKLTSYATNEDLEEQVTELNSTITQTASEINAEVEKKVDEDIITGAYLILKINEDTSEAKLNADKIELSANDILNLLAGNTINLTSKNIVIASNNFNVDKNGNVTCKNININGGKILLEDDNTSSSYSLFKVSNTDGNKYVSVKPFEINIINENDNNSLKTQITNNASKINLDHKSGSNISLQITDDGASISVNGNTGHSYMFEDEIRSPKLTQTSLESIKKNISKFNKNATDIINNSDVYEYNLKSDEDTDKKLIGFIIGDGYRTPEEVISKDGQSVELYSTIGILCKAVQELSTRVKQLERRYNMNKITFEDGTKTQEAYVTVGEQNYQVNPAVWQGTTPLKAQNLNKMQDNIEEAINVQRASVTLESTVNANTNYTLPVYYEVGNNSLEVFYCGSKLEKGTDYNEIGNTGDVSNIIQFLDSVGDLDMSDVDGFEDFEETLEFVVRGEYSASEE